MTITLARKPANTPTTPEAFIAAAPDASPPRAGRKVQISLTLSPDLLRAVDAKAREIGTSRAGLINLALHAAITQGLLIEPERTDA